LFYTPYHTLIYIQYTLLTSSLCVLQVLEYSYNTSVSDMQGFIETYFKEDQQPQQLSQEPQLSQQQPTQEPQLPQQLPQQLSQQLSQQSAQLLEQSMQLLEQQLIPNIHVPIPIPVPTPMHSPQAVLIDYMRGFDQVLGQRDQIVPLDPRLRM
jgi:DNA segregation ATPase FtsK/SpoIIIE-like protein